MSSEFTSRGALPAGPRMNMAADEALAAALRRMALEQVDVMMRGFVLEADDETLDHNVHVARKAGKRIRSLLRLVRPQLGEDAYRWANRLVRDQGRRLSEIRTSKVLLLTIDELVADGSLPEEDVQQIRAQLSGRHDQMLERLRGDVEGRASATASLTALADRIRESPAPAEYATQDLGALEKATGSSYRTAKKAMRKAGREASVHAFHDWRKRINYLRYQFEALSGACAPPVSELVDTLDELSEVLGEEHDLADFLDVAADLAAPLPDDVRVLIDARVQSLRERCLEDGAQVFADAPQGFNRFFAEHARPNP